MTYSILIVHGDSDVKTSMQEHLESSAYAVKTANDGPQALSILNQCPMDIVVADISMAGENGLELTRTIKQKYDIDVMAMTEHDETKAQENAMRAGVSDFVFTPFHHDELNLRIKRVLKERAFNQERCTLLEELRKLAITDDLTGLHNARHFSNQIKIEIQRHNRYDRSLSLLILDIDFFKNYNDTWGHLEGDKVLSRIGTTINSCMRFMDSAFRYGGEEFAVILPETGIEKACLVGNRIKKRIAQEIFHPAFGKTASVTISVGASEWLPNEDMNSFIRRTDIALYQAKARGRNCLASSSQNRG